MQHFLCIDPKHASLPGPREAEEFIEVYCSHARSDFVFRRLMTLFVKETRVAELSPCQESC